MKNINDRMIEECLNNLKRMRRLKPYFVIIGLAMLTLSGITIYFVYSFIQQITPLKATGITMFYIAMYTFNIAFQIILGTFLLCIGLLKNNRDIIIEHLAEQYLKEKKDLS